MLKSSFQQNSKLEEAIKMIKRKAAGRIKEYRELKDILMTSVSILIKSIHFLKFELSSSFELL